MAWLFAVIATIIIGLCSWWYLKNKKNQNPSPQSEPLAETLGHLHIYIGSQTGHAEKLAYILAHEAVKYSFSPHIISLDNFQIRDFKKHDFCVIICSTQEDGAPPSNASQFLKWITKVAKASNENLSQLSYAVFGLNKKIDTNSQATARKISDSLLQLGANQLIKTVESHENDIEEFNKWKEQLWQILPGIVKKTRISPFADFEFLEVAHHVNLTKPNPSIVYEESSKTLITSMEFPVTKIKELKRDPESSALHVEMKIEGEYETACNFGIFPENDEEIVRELAALQDYDLELTFQFLPIQGKKHPFPTPLTVGEALTKYCDLTSLIRKKIIKNISKFAGDPEEQKELEFLASLKGKDEYRRIVEEPMITIVDLLRKYSSVKIPIGALVQILDRIQARHYTVASSSKMNKTTIHIAVDVARHRTSEGKIRTGLCSGYFEKMHVTGLYKPIRGFFKTSAFKLPPVPTPIIMICNGCGVAPFRGFLQELQCYASEGIAYPETILYFGSRNKTSEFVYKRDLENFIIPSDSPASEFEYRPEKWGEGPHVLHSLFVAFSRDQAHKIYVQDIIFTQHDKIWDLLANKGAYLYICGSTMMGKGVSDMLKTIANEHLGEDSTEFISKLTNEGRFRVEFWG